MKTLTINIKNDSDYRLLVLLASRLGINATMVEDKKEKVYVKQMQGLYKLLDNVKVNELFKEIEDPVQWQKDLRDEWK